MVMVAVPVLNEMQALTVPKCTCTYERKIHSGKIKRRSFDTGIYTN